jgi:transcriptional regulator with XRE-family HTH domain
VGSTEQRKQCLLAKNLHLRLLAVTQNVNQIDIARRSGVDRGTVAKILANNSDQPFHFATAEDVLNALKVTFSDEEILDASIGSVPSGLIPLPMVDSPFVGATAKQLLSQVAGRDELLRQIFEELDKGSNLSLLGKSQVGKTWLLHQISEQGNQRLKKKVNDLIYLDLREINPGQFFSTLCGELGIDPPLRGIDLRRALKGKRYVMCLDEVDQLSDQDRFSKLDRDQLCSICSSSDSVLNLVLASQTALNVLFPDEPNRTSPFIGIFKTMDVMPISRIQVEKFVLGFLAERQLKFTQQQIDEIHQKSQGKLEDVIDLAHQQFQDLIKIRS